MNSYTLGDTATGHWLHQHRYCIPQTTKYLHIQSVDSLRDVTLPSAAASVEYIITDAYVVCLMDTYITFASENHQVTKLR